MLSALSVPRLAAAQEAPPRDDRLSVVQRADETYGAPGMRVGSMMFDASLDLDTAYDSNVRATGSNRRPDVFVTAIPAIAVQSEWPQDAFAFKAHGEFKNYLSTPSENINNAGVTATGRLDLGASAYALATGGYQLLHEDRGALAPSAGRNPTQYAVASAATALVLDTAPFGLRLDATVDSYAYNNAVAPDATPIPETGRDHIVYAVEPRLSYQIQPQYNAFIRAVVNRRQYNDTREGDGLDRHSTGYKADLGLALDMTGFASWELYVGYLEQNYDAALLRPISAVDFGANLEWRPSEQTSIRFNVARSVEESALPASQGFLQTAVRLAIEHELVPRILLSGSARFIHADFAGGIGSTNLYDLSLGARYLLTNRVSAGLEYDFRHRGSIAGLTSYSRQIIMLRLRGEL